MPLETLLFPADARAESVEGRFCIALYLPDRAQARRRRWLVFFMSIPLAMLSTMARILVLVFGSMVFGQPFAVGKGDHYASNFHLLAGVAVYLVALAGLVGVERGINRLFGREKPLKLVEAKSC